MKDAVYLDKIILCDNLKVERKFMREKMLLIKLFIVIFMFNFGNILFSDDKNKSENKIINSELQLFVDEWLIEKMNNVSIKLHQPQRKEVVFIFDKTWEGKESGYIGVFKDGDKFKMYYRGGGESSREYTCFAESSDGIKWFRPELNLVEHNGSKKNNIIWTADRASYGESHNFSVFLDTNPNAKPDEHYKAVGLGWYLDKDGEKQRGLISFSSPDGIHWKKMSAECVIRDGAFDSQNTAFWDEVKKQYVCHLRIGKEGKRSIAQSVSNDFITWTKPVPLNFGNTQAEHLYTNAIVPYFRSPSIYIGFPMRFVPERKQIGKENRTIDGTSDGVFISSRDGLNWDRTFMEAFIRPGISQNNWGQAHGNNMPVWGILNTSDNEMSIYWAENYVGTPQIRRGTLRIDGFASVNAGYNGGEFLTYPLIAKGNKLIINYSTSAIGFIKVELLNREGKIITGFGLDSCPEIFGDEIERVVSWNNKTDISEILKEPIRIRFVMKDADLYSIKFRE